MPSSIAVFARPVRIFWRSRLNESTAFFMPSSVSVAMSLIMVPLRSGVLGLLGVAHHAGAHGLAREDGADVAGLSHVEDDDRHLVVAAQRERGRVHDVQILAQ